MNIFNVLLSCALLGQLLARPSHRHRQANHAADAFRSDTPFDYDSKPNVDPLTDANFDYSDHDRKHIHEFLADHEDTAKMDKNGYEDHKGQSQTEDQIDEPLRQHKNKRKLSRKHQQKHELGDFDYGVDEDDEDEYMHVGRS